MIAVFVSLITFASTFCGGLFALKFRRHIHLILGFTAGVLLGVISFDVLPEIFAIAQEHALNPSGAMIALVVGFLLFHSFEKLVMIHHAQEEVYANHHHPHVGLLSAAALIGHSFMDGIGIGLGFQVSQEIGIAVAVAVIAHDFSDGLNTMSLMLVNKNTTRSSLGMLLLDSIAPILGAASTLLFNVPPSILVLYLGFFAGFLLYISAADILPEAHAPRPSTRALLLTCLGTIFIFVTIRAIS